MSPRSRIATALVCGSIAALAATAPAAAADCSNQDIHAIDQSEGQIEDSLQCLINEQRAEAGLPTVRPEGRLRSAAQRHSNDMVSSSYFAHDAPAGDTFIDRISATGYMRGSSSWLVGENLVWGTSSLSTPASMVEAWMNSPDHRANILRPRFREIGISAVRGTPYDATDDDGITVSSEYGVRKVHKGGKGARSARKAKKRSAQRKKRSH
jgi:uncharacterized protein YkwD